MKTSSPGVLQRNAQSFWHHPFVLTLLLVGGLLGGTGCKGSSKATDPIKPAPANDVSFWLTTPNQSALLKKQNFPLVFSTASNANATIDVSEEQTFQTIDGFGYTLTGGSATHINKMAQPQRDALLQELFGTDSASIGVSYLRISIGASDLSEEPFTYNDMPQGQTDPALQNFSIARERTDLIPVLKKIIAISPSIKILGSPWTAPPWMKDSFSYIGSRLKPEHYGVYAQYFVKYIKAMAAEGITIDAITIQNEPLHPGNNPSMYMEATEQAKFIKNHLGPLFQQEGIQTKIIVYDHNLDRPDYPLTILNDPEAKKYVDGSAFHHYAGTIDVMSQVHNAHPDKHVYFTEQWVGGPSNFAADLKWHVETLTIGAPRNWSRNVLEWNLAADPSYQPHTDRGGCTNCLGAITISGNSVTRNVAYYTIGHASKFVRPGSVRIQSNVPPMLPNVAFRTPDGKKVLIVINTATVSQNFNIRYNGKLVVAALEPGAAGTFVW
jgi:glucosylceramidase